MEYPFSIAEKFNRYPTFRRDLMESRPAVSMDSGVRGSDLEDSYYNVSEIMNFDTYAVRCNSPNNLGEHMFPSFALPPSTVSASTSFGLTFIDHQYNSGFSVVDNDMVTCSSFSGDKGMFYQMDTYLPFPMNSCDDSIDLIDRRDESLSHDNALSEKENSAIPRSPTQSLAEKMLRALYLFKEWSGGGILAQVWVPMKSGDQYILSTCEQPYLLDQTLSGYREVSRSFIFAAESKPGSFQGLPSRVFISKIPEWTSNVMYYSEAEFLRVQHALNHEVRGSIALPVFEDDSPESCCAVLELVTMKEKSNFDLEIENVCSALQAVKLRSIVPPRLYPQSLSKNQRVALSEIADVLRVICHAHRLPLALTWIPCSYTEGSSDEINKIRARGCDMSKNEKFVLCVDVDACYVNDKDMQGFVHACAQHYLEEGQGIVGKALQSNHPFFYPDVKEYHISDYPLVQHARKFGLNAAIAIRLRSIYTGDNDYILEFFLPVSMEGSTEQQLLLDNLSITMRKICKSLRTSSDVEFLGVEGLEVKLHDREVKTATAIELCNSSSEQSHVDGNLNFADHLAQNLSKSKNTVMKADGPCDQALVGSRKRMEKKRSTAEKHVSLSVLQQYFSGSLKDAAKSLGVCPTTLKRICRQHGISRWPYRKINKVNRSLRKIQNVIDSVQGVEGGLKFSTIQESYTTKSALFPIKDNSFRNKALSIHNPKSAQPSSCMDIETTIVKMEDKPEASESDFISQSSESMKALYEMRTNLKNDHTVMDKDDDNQPSSSGMTDSSNGSGSLSMLNGISSSFGPKTEEMSGNKGSTITVKATYNEDTIRFKFEPSAECDQLYEEVAKRFKLQTGHFQLKYLDDEDEWVMLVNDSDLQECLGTLDFLGTHNVKFLVRDVPFYMGSSGSINSFLKEGFS